jgi:hypothetical protein
MAKPAMRAEQMAQTSAVRDETRVGPDPVTVILPALAALGAIASVAAMNWACSDLGERRRARRNAAHVLRDLERDCLDLQDTFRRLVRGLPDLASGGGTSALPFKLGVHGLEVNDDSYPLYQSLVSSLGSLIVRASQDAYDLMLSIEDGSVAPPEEVFYAFAEAQDRLNQILAQRPSLKVTVETGFDIAIKLTGVVEELKGHLRV